MRTAQYQLLTRFTRRSQEQARHSAPGGHSAVRPVATAGLTGLQIPAATPLGGEPAVATPAPQQDESFRPRCLSVDLEVGKENGRIRAFGAVRADNGQRPIPSFVRACSARSGTWSSPPSSCSIRTSERVRPVPCIRSTRHPRRWRTGRPNGNNGIINHYRLGALPARIFACQFE